ncbi:hypothetical protein AKJ66_01440 [candidate division MSBL1 archaeon SCGC-AAA259E22]|uniref:Uncharacterized protein n=1 Tax=candidate division MSBL1 archaeon SCGC-AAA259E22 TaxID=1698265 RepID=A0A133UHM9_9EURY|nr:hypothetical protein AKJ66_01440 [candidate division MSBL1 archaeon SCGC-AAA259E22]
MQDLDAGETYRVNLDGCVKQFEVESQKIGGEPLEPREEKTERGVSTLPIAIVIIIAIILVVIVVVQGRR